MMDSEAEEFFAKTVSITEASDALMTRMLAELGESPEAWRGAVFVSNNIRQILMLCMNDLGALEADARQPSVEEAASIMFSVIAALTGIVKAIADNNPERHR